MSCSEKAKAGWKVSSFPLFLFFPFFSSLFLSSFLSFPLSHFFLPKSCKFQFWHFFNVAERSTKLGIHFLMIQSPKPNWEEKWQQKFVKKLWIPSELLWMTRKNHPQRLVCFVLFCFVLFCFVCFVSIRNQQQFHDLKTSSIPWEKKCKMSSMRNTVISIG